MHKFTEKETELVALKLAEVPRDRRSEWAACKIRETGEEPNGELIFDYLVSAYKEGEYS